MHLVPRLHALPCSDHFHHVVMSDKQSISHIFLRLPNHSQLFGREFNWRVVLGLLIVQQAANFLDQNRVIRLSNPIDQVLFC